MSELDTLLKGFQKAFGTEVGGQGIAWGQVERISSGVFEFDIATGGGIPCSRISILYGPEASGKTSLAYKLIGSCQKKGKEAAYINIEHVYDEDRAKLLGVDTSRLVVLTPPNAEAVCDIVEGLLGAKEVGLVVVDSVGNMVPENEADSSADKQIVSGNAPIVSKMVRKSVLALSQESKRGHNPALLILNQIRMKIGIMFGDPETQPGGNLLRFASSLTVRMYGKDIVVKEVSENLPTWKETSCIIRKWRVPIFKRAFDYRFCLVPHDFFSLGDTDSFGEVDNWLRAAKKLYKEGTVWNCCGSEFSTLAEIKQLYLKDKEVRDALQSEVVKFVMVPHMQVDMDTGEILEK